MIKKDNIHIRIELCKDGNSGNITLLTYFDPNAPNFSQDNNGFYWLPTSEEKDFLNEVFEIFPEFEMKSPHIEKTTTKPLEQRKQRKDNSVVNEPSLNMEKREPEKTMNESLEKKEESTTTNSQQVDTERREPEKTMTDSIEKNQITPPPPQAYIERNETEHPSSPFEKQDRQYPIDNVPPFQKTEETNSNTNQVNPNTNELREETKDEPRREFVEADDQDFDRALEKGEDKSMVEADEDTIVERVLSQKQKGKWSRER